MRIRSELAVDEFKIHNEFQTHHLDFELSNFPPLMNSKLI